MLLCVLTRRKWELVFGATFKKNLQHTKQSYIWTYVNGIT